VCPNLRVSFRANLYLKCTSISRIFVSINSISHFPSSQHRWNCGGQISHADQILDRASQSEDPMHFAHSAMPHFPDQRNRLQPAEVDKRGRITFPTGGKVDVTIPATNPTTGLPTTAAEKCALIETAINNSAWNTSISGNVITIKPGPQGDVSTSVTKASINANALWSKKGAGVKSCSLRATSCAQAFQ
jgi:hypothetical protein